MTTTSEIDIEQFNEAAQALYDVAFSRGFRQGVDQTLTEQTQRHAFGLLKVAETILNNLEPIELAEFKWRMAIARMILGRTPMVVPEVTRALNHLRYKKLDGPTVEEAATALALIRDGLKKLRTRS